MARTSSHTYSKVKKLTKDEEADLIIDKLKRTDAERDLDFINEINEFVNRIAAESLKKEIDKEIIKQVQADYLNKITTRFPELKK